MVVDEQRGRVPPLNLNALGGLERGLTRLTLLNGDDTVLANGLIHLSNNPTHDAVIVTRDSSHVKKTLVSERLTNALQIRDDRTSERS